ncbi:MAG: hypothetical protein GY789_02750 [Hyphomicrobiales bacterium]|nr:hypothetical protein [Hyphomicrobiales bacterium]MCP5001070.1 hypothetical protein [Hyphomicrobiales bacterium]
MTPGAGDVKPAAKQDKTMQTAQLTLMVISASAPDAGYGFACVRPVDTAAKKTTITV